MSKNLLKIGGQAVLEGVMIKSQNYYTTSVRKGKQIISKTIKLKKRTLKIAAKPVFRGFFNLIDMIKIGIKAIMWSAEQIAGEDERITKSQMAFTVLVSVFMVVIFFVLLPYLLTNWIGFQEESSPFLFNLIDGVIRISFFMIYLLVISLLSDVKTLFKYHGAEHMAVHCYEKGKKLTVKNVRKYPTMHPRCGTSFLLLVLVIAILVFSVVPSILKYFYPAFLELNVFLRRAILFAVRLLLLPLIAGISYEALKASDSSQDNIFFSIISFPGLMLQKITTKTPTKEQIEVAINSVKEIVRSESK